MLVQSQLGKHCVFAVFPTTKHVDMKQALLNRGVHVCYIGHITEIAKLIETQKDRIVTYSTVIPFSSDGVGRKRAINCPPPW